jgi:hypothetical protein
VTLASFWESAGTFLTVMTPLVAVPLTVITFYLRSIREHQVSWHAEWVRRVETIEASSRDLHKTVGEFERDYTTKEEWLRECMLARRTLEQLRETTVRLETTLSGLIRFTPSGPHLTPVKDEWAGGTRDNRSAYETRARSNRSAYETRAHSERSTSGGHEGNG